MTQNTKGGHNMPPITNDWAEALKEEYRKDYYKKLFDFVGREYATGTVYPPGDDIFNAFFFEFFK